MKQVWSIPKMWQGQRVAILASGPSMSKEIAEAVRWHADVRVIAINTTFKLAPWADMIYAGDASWWKAHWDEVCKTNSLRVSCSDAISPEVLYLKPTGKNGFDPDPSQIRTGGNSGYQAIHVAAHAGARQILLCGFNMKGGHWHGRHASPLRDHGESIYDRWIECFKTLAPELGQRGIEVINCTPDSALNVWPKMNLEKALEMREKAVA